MNVKYELQRIANTILTYCYHVKGNGLAHGKLGLALFLFYYARSTGQQCYRQYAEELLYGIQKLSSTLPMDFADGLYGLVWTINHLEQEQMIAVPQTGSVNQNPQIMCNVKSSMEKMFAAEDKLDVATSCVEGEIKAYWRAILQCKTDVAPFPRAEQVCDYVDNVQKSLVLDRLVLDGGLAGLGLLLLEKYSDDDNN